MKTLHTVNAVIELVASLALLCCPSAAVAILLGALLEAASALVVARVCGGALLALSVACWFARDDAQTRAARGLATAMLLYDVVAAAVLVYAGIGLGLHGVALWPGVVLHSLMAVWCVVCLRRSLS